MKSRSGWRWLRLLAGVVLPLLAGVLAAPATAQASCGDYVMLGGDHAPPAETHPPAASRELPSPLPEPRPCSGPHCHRHTPLPPPAVPIAPVQVEDDRCCPPAPLRLGDSRSWVRLPDASCLKPARLSATVYHPPRLSAA